MIPEKHEDFATDNSKDIIDITKDIAKNVTSTQLTSEELIYLNDFRANKQTRFDNLQIELVKEVNVKNEDTYKALNDITETSNEPDDEKQEIIDKRQDKKKLLMRIGGGILAVIAIATVLVLPKKASNNQIPKTTVSTSIPANNVTPDITNQSIPSTSSQTTTEQQSTVETGNIEIVEQKLSVEAMDAMTIEQFAMLPYADRAGYTFMKDPTLEVASTNEKFDPKTIPGYYWQAIMINAVALKDITAGKKMMSALEYYTYDNQTGGLTGNYNGYVNLISKMGGRDALLQESFIYKDSGVIQPGIDNENNKILYTNVTYDIEDGKGTQLLPEETSQLFQITIKLLDGRTIVAYPEGRQVPGHNPTDSNTY